MAQLGAQFIVRGSVRRSGKRVRISVQLLDSHAGASLWADRFDRELEDVFVVQDELSSTIVSTLAGRVEAARLDRARRAPPERLDPLRRAVQRRLRAIEDNDHFGNRRNLRSGLHELKFRQVIRIYFANIDGQFVLLLGGSGKRNQDREIAKARARLKDFQERTK